MSFARWTMFFVHQRMNAVAEGHSNQRFIPPMVVYPPRDLPSLIVQMVCREA